MNWYRNSLPVMKWPECDVDHSLHPLPKLRISRAEPLLPIYAVMVSAGSSLPLSWIRADLQLAFTLGLCSPYDVSGASVSDTSWRQWGTGPCSRSQVRCPTILLWQSSRFWVGLYHYSHPVSSFLSLEVFMLRWWWRWWGGRQNSDVAKSSVVFYVCVCVCVCVCVVSVNSSCFVSCI
jgi:hypothetical protein